MTSLIDHLSHTTAIVGTTGAGKTYAAKSVVEELLALKRRVIIIDPTGAWYGLRAGSNGGADGGFPVLIFGGEHADIPIVPEAGEQVAEALAVRDVQAIIDTSEMTGGEKTRFLTSFLQKLYALNKASLHLIVDEADEVIPQNPMPEERRLSGAFDKIVRRGRIKGFRPLMITQRPAVIHKNALSQIGTLVALKLTSPQDRKAIEDWVKGNADADQARAVMSSLSALKRGEGWIWSPADQVLERVTFPSIRTFDSSRTPDADEAIVDPALTAVDVDALRAAMMVADAPHEAPAAERVASKAEIAAAEKRGYLQGFEAGRRSQHALSYREGLHRAAKKIIKVANTLPDLEPSDIDSPPTGAALTGHAEDTDFSTAGSTPVEHTIAPPWPDKPNGPKKQPKAAAKHEYDSEAIAPSSRKIVDAVVAAYPLGISLVTAAKRVGISVKSSAFRRYIKEAEQSPRIRDRGDGRFVATAADESVTAPLGLAAFKDRLPPAYSRMLEAIERAAGRELDLDAISELSGVSRTSSGLTTGLRELASLELIVKTPKGWRLSEDFL